MKKIPKWTLALVTGVVALGATACGDDTGGGGATGDAEAGMEGGVDDSAGDDTADDDAADDDTADDDAADDDTTDDATDDGAADDDAADDAADDDAADDTTDDASDDDAADDASDDDAADDSVTDEGPDAGPDDGATDDGSGPDGDAGPEGGTPAASGDIDDLIGAICDWEFRCCDRGELDYRLGPNSTSAEDCRADFVFELRQSNSTNNEYRSGSAASGLLAALAFSVDLRRVELNESAIAECIEAYEALGCAEPLMEVTSCGGPVDYTANPCALNNLFIPILEQGDQCTLGLTETSLGNDVECVSGSTCLPADDPENPSDDPACVQRGLDGQPCNNDDECDFDHYCNEAGDCQAKGAVGDPCAFTNDDQPAPGEESMPCKMGLSCDPISLECVDNCSVDFSCVVDSQCPDGTSCAPLTVGDDNTSFKHCRELGASASARCDSDADCVESRYCNADGVCAADADEDETCTVDGQCPEGTYCNDAVAQCAAFTLRGDACARVESLIAPGQWESEECEPAALGCIYDPTDAVTKCSTGKLELDEACLVDYDCESNMCEFATEDATEATCIAGGGEGDDCDTDVATGVETRCAPGLLCRDAVCVPLLAPGSDCKDAADAADSAICGGAVCEERWDEAGEFMCTDAPVPTSAGGTGLTCDGSEG